MVKNFADKLVSQIKKKKSYVCVGLDPNFDGAKCIPNFLLEETNNDYNEAIFEFNKSIIDNTHKQTSIFKPQSAFYEKYEAYDALKKTIEYIQSKNCIAICDAKRNDIGNTSRAYASAIFENLNADAVTINGYLGIDCILPFVEHSDRGIFILVKTSNKSSGDFQDIFAFSSSLMDYLKQTIGIEKESLSISELLEVLQAYKLDSGISHTGLISKNYIIMAQLVKKWSMNWEKSNETEHHYSNIGAVVGATYPSQLKEIRSIISSSFILIPGFGAQGGKANDIIHGFNNDGLGAIVNSSRGINYAYASKIDETSYKAEEYGEAAGVAAIKMKNEINQVLEKNNLLAW